ncbi:hypothetical protein DFH09DRAFT_1365041 [Mycena vulgaris]|nr:hypothetical protein DFH09DRAFT_1365041 [Mycena vulgaris]
MTAVKTYELPVNYGARVPVPRHRTGHFVDALDNSSRTNPFLATPSRLSVSLPPFCSPHHAHAPSISSARSTPRVPALTPLLLYLNFRASPELLRYSLPASALTPRRTSNAKTTTRSALDSDFCDPPSALRRRLRIRGLPLLASPLMHIRTPARRVLTPLPPLLQSSTVTRSGLHVSSIEELDPTDPRWSSRMGTRSYFYSYHRRYGPPLARERAGADALFPFLVSSAPPIRGGAPGWVHVPSVEAFFAADLDDAWWSFGTDLRASYSKIPTSRILPPVFYQCDAGHGLEQCS